MKNAQLNVGVVGLGRLGSLYAEYLAYQIPTSNLIAIADIDQDRMNELAEDLDVQHKFSDYRQMIALSDLDAIVITTSTSFHKEVIVEAAKNGKKIFCEKPLSISLEDVKEIKGIIEDNRTFLYMGFMRRFDPGYSAAKEKIEKGEIGDPIVFKASSRDPFRPSLDYAAPEKSGGLFLDMGIHDFDLARWFMGEVSEVYSIGNVLAYPEMETINDIDNSMTTIKFENGKIGTVDLSRSGIYGYDIHTEILGTEGTIRIGYLRETPITVLKKDCVSHDTVPYFMERFEMAYKIQLKDFIDKAYKEEPPTITVRDGEQALLISHAATSSYKTQQAVCIDNEQQTFQSKTEIQS
jgi:inositol 2-dehydrogenase